MWGYYRADPAAYASSQRLCVYGIWPTGTAKGTDRWWSSPARTGYDRDPRQSDPTHTHGEEAADGLDGTRSALVVTGEDTGVEWRPGRDVPSLVPRFRSDPEQQPLPLKAAA